jgi:hypothetical protein
MVKTQTSFFLEYTFIWTKMSIVFLYYLELKIFPAKAWVIFFWLGMVLLKIIT